MMQEDQGQDIVVWCPQAEGMLAASGTHTHGAPSHRPGSNRCAQTKNSPVRARNINHLIGVLHQLQNGSL